MQIKLYKYIDSALRLVDYGVRSHMETYAACGFIVIIDYSAKQETAWKLR